MKKTIRNILVFLLLIFITFYVVFQEHNFMDVIKTFKNVDYVFITLAIGCMILYVLCDAINIDRMLKKLGEKSSFLKNIKYSLIGFFFSAITPAASGGQPMQIYYMHKDNITVANSTLTFLVNLSCMQIATISLALFGVIFNYQYMNPGMAFLFVVGILLNLIALIMLIISLFSRRATKGLINFVIKILTFFKAKNIEQKKERMEKELEKYQQSSKYIIKNKHTVIKNLITTFIQFIAQYSVTYFTYLALGFREYNMFNLVTIQAVIFGTVSGIPSPGSVGVSEGAYLSLLGQIYKNENFLSSAMLISRGINFYLLVMVSALVVIVNDIIVKVRKNYVTLEKKENNQNEM